VIAAGSHANAPSWIVFGVGFTPLFVVLAVVGITSRRGARNTLASRQAAVLAGIAALCIAAIIGVAYAWNYLP